MTLVQRMRDALVRGTAGTDRTPTAPQIPSPGPDAASQKRTLDAIKQVIDMREGTSGSPLDQHLTLRDILDAGLAQLQLPNGTTYGPGAGANSGLVPVGGTSASSFDDPRPVLSVPPAPTNLTVSGAFTNVIVTWDLLDFQNFSYTEVWRATTNAIGSATKIGTSTARIYVDETALLGTGYYYWVRTVGVLTTGGTATGPYNAVSGVAGGRLFVGGSDISALTIQAANLANGSVTAATLAANSIAVGTAAVQNGAIVNAMIANLAVDNAKIASLDGAKINAGTVTASQIAAATITGSNVAAFTLTAGNIDTRNLTIKDSGGNVLFGAGVTVSVSLLPQNVQNNLLDCSWWQLGTAVTAKGWTINGNTGSGGSDSFFVGTNAQGASEVLWRSIADNSGGSSGSGGWNPGGTSFFNFDGTKTYRFVIPIYRSGGASGSVYWGIAPNSVCSLNTTTAHSNPYFVGGVSPTTSKWFLYVGYVFPYGSTGNSHTGAGYYDMTTGELVAGGLNWNWASAGTVGSGPRAYQFYASAGSAQYFGKPRIELVDGGEESLAGILATGSVSARNQVTSGNASTYIANAAIDSAQINNLRTSNYAEDGSGNPTAGAKLASAGTALKIANSALQVGTAVFTDYWVRLVQGIDGASGTALIWRGNNDASTRGGAPNISCLSITTLYDQMLNSNFQQTYLNCKLTPTSYTSYSDNLDAMQQIHIQFFEATSSSSPFTECYLPCPSRTYDGASGIVNASLHWGWRYGGTGSSGTSVLHETNNAYDACIRVRIANTYGWSATKDLYGGGASAAVGRVMTATTITGSSGSSGGGGGSTGGGCPAPWVKVKLASGLEVPAGDLYNGCMVAAVNDSTFEPIPAGGRIKDIARIWKMRYRLRLTNGQAHEFSEGHRLGVVDRGWVNVEKIRPGDHIMGLSESVVESNIAAGEGQVISFLVAGAGTYFAGGLLCHNNKLIP